MKITNSESQSTEVLVLELFPSIGQLRMKKFLDKIGPLLEKITLTLDGKYWTILKSHAEIEAFVEDYTFHFDRSFQKDFDLLQKLFLISYDEAASTWEPLIVFFETEDLEYQKVKSIKLLKKCGGRYSGYRCCRLFWQWKYRQFVITKHGILYYKVKNKEKLIKEYLPFNSYHVMLYGPDETDYELGIKLESNHRRFLLWAKDYLLFVAFLFFMKLAMSMKRVEVYRFESFAPVRENNHVQFLIDGEDYFSNLAMEIERAESRILICGWWISPEFYLIRPVKEHENYRFDRLLRRVAEKGVKIFILVYYEPKYLTNDSRHTKKILYELSDNIKVLQHPLGILPSFWSHHEKAVIVDQRIGFLGGLDICYGRFDTSGHRINENNPDYYPGIEYNNIRLADFVNVKEHNVDSVPRDRPRLPWHDVAIKLEGDVVLDIVNHFIEYWNYANFQSQNEKRYVLIMDSANTELTLKEKMKRRLENISIFKAIKKIKYHIFKSYEPEKKYITFGDNLKLNHRISQPVIGVHEIKLPYYLYGSNEDIDIQIPKTIRREDRTETDNISQIHSPNTPYTKLKSIKELDALVELEQDNINERAADTNFPVDAEVILRMSLQPRLVYLYQNLSARSLPYGDNMSCQIVRSVSNWSIGCKQSNMEKSILTAYLNLIYYAEKFIYIENQFFISAADKVRDVKNYLADAIYKRIELAVYEEKEFYVFVLMPLVPGFAGDLDDPNAVLPRIIMHWQYYTITRGPNSLYARLYRLGVNPEKYIRFYGLRTHALINGIPETEIIYLHSKLMIVDDKKLICGSANINDRSLLGSRDSYLCVVVEGAECLPVKIGAGIMRVNEKIHNFRVRLFGEHFGLTNIEASNPVSTRTLNKINHIAKTNTLVYRETFGCYPDDNIRSLPQLRAFRLKEISHKDYEILKQKIIGNVVEFPLCFLEDENLLDGSTLYPTILST